MYCPGVQRDSTQVILCLNLFRDQLDRYGEIDTISQRWIQAIATLPQCPWLRMPMTPPSPPRSTFAPKFVFGCTSNLRNPRCRLDCLSQLWKAADISGVYLSHLGDFHCPGCDSQSKLADRQWPQILIGLYNKYNTLAAVSRSQLGIDEDTIRDTIATGGFGRAEELTVNGKQVWIIEEPSGNETIRAVPGRWTNDAASVE